MNRDSSYRSQSCDAAERRLALPLSNRFRDALLAACPDLAPLPSGRELIAFQRRKDVDPAKQDLVLTTLMRCRKGSPADYEPFLVLLVALRPKLDSIYRNRVRFSVDPDETWAEIIESFELVTRTFPEDRHEGIATGVWGLVHNQLKGNDQVRAEDAEGQRVLARVVAPIVEQMAPRARPIGLLEFSEDDGPPAAPDDSELQAVERLLVEAGEEDMNRRIVIGVAVHGRTPIQLARELGLKRTAVKNRFDRAIQRLARKLRKFKRDYDHKRSAVPLDDETLL